MFSLEVRGNVPGNQFDAVGRTVNGLLVGETSSGSALASDRPAVILSNQRFTASSLIVSSGTRSSYNSGETVPSSTARCIV